MIKIQHFHCQGLGPIAGQGDKILQAGQPKKKKKTQTLKHQNYIFGFMSGFSELQMLNLRHRQFLF